MRSYSTIAYQGGRGESGGDNIIGEGVSANESWVTFQFSRPRVDQRIELTDLITVDLTNHPGIRAIHFIICIKISFDPFYMENNFIVIRVMQDHLRILIFEIRLTSPPGV